MKLGYFLGLTKSRLLKIKSLYAVQQFKHEKKLLRGEDQNKQTTFVLLLPSPSKRTVKVYF